MVTSCLDPRDFSRILMWSGFPGLKMNVLIQEYKDSQFNALLHPEDKFSEGTARRQQYKPFPFQGLYTSCPPFLYCYAWEVQPAKREEDWAAEVVSDA